MSRGFQRHTSIVAGAWFASGSMTRRGWPMWIDEIEAVELTVGAAVERPVGIARSSHSAATWSQSRGVACANAPP